MTDSFTILMVALSLHWTLKVQFAFHFVDKTLTTIKRAIVVWLAGLMFLWAIYFAILYFVEKL